MTVTLTVLGSINADITATSERLPTAGETVSGGTLTRTPGGKGANQAAAAARLGARTRFVGAVGDDADGAFMRASLREAGVDTTHVKTVDAATGTALIMVDAQGENQISVCDGANALVGVEGVEFAADETVLAQLEVPLETVAEAARRHPGYFALNAAPALELPADLIDRADLIIVNETEFELIPALAEAKLVAVTYGAKGSAILEYGKQIAFAEAEKTTAVNTVGAGDAFCAALVIALREGDSYENALQTANRVGAAAVADPLAQPELGLLEHYMVRR